MTYDRYYDEDGRLIAIIIRPHDGPNAVCMSEGIKFFTHPSAPLQVGMMRHIKGKIISAHRHLEGERLTTSINEVLFIVRGRARVDLYGAGYEIQSAVLEAGDVIILMAGGHGFEVLEDFEAWEVKTGPYLPGQDKVPITKPASVTTFSQEVGKDGKLQEG